MPFNDFTLYEKDSFGVSNLIKMSARYKNKLDMK